MKVKQRSVSDQKPNAWIVDPKDRGRKSVKKDNKVYLQDGKEFQIELYNPLKESVLAEIKINGKPASSTGLIIRPCERFYLDCFVDDKKKFVFKTYMVENTEESKKAISVNGMVEVFFYKEETLLLNNWRSIFNPVIERHYHHYYPWYPYNRPYWYYGTTTSLGTIQASSNNLSYGGSLTSYTTNTFNSNYNGSLASYTVSNNSSLLGGSSTYTSTYNSDTQLKNLQSNIETGRIERGKISQQKFEEVDMQFERLHISSVIYQLLPESQKPVETKEIKSETNEVRNSDIVGLIKKLADLHNSGILTDDEFNSKKQELLSRI